jgi:hypothetical protein
MVTSTEYHALAKALAARGTPLMTPPDGYQRAHELPGWYDTFLGLTPPSAWIPLNPREVPGEDALERLVRELPQGPGIIKDYVKSRKHEWLEACYVPDLGNRIHKGTTLRPKKGSITSYHGKSIQRGGFGSKSHSHSSGG